MFATDTNYPTGALAYSGTVTKRTMPAAEIAVGHRPGERMPAQWENDYKNLLSSHLAGIADIAACNWPTSGNNIDTTSVGFCSQTNFRAVVLAGSAEGDALLVQLNNNNSVSYSTDLRAWTKQSAAAASLDDGLVAGAVGGTNFLISWNSIGSGVVKKSSDLGASWQDAGTFAKVGTSSYGAFMVAQNRFVLASGGAIHTSDNLANSAWTSRTIPGSWGGAPPPPPISVGTGSDGILFGLNADGVAGVGDGSMIYSNDGITYSYFETGGANEITSVTYNESHSLWLVTDSAGKVWTSPNGAATWTDRGAVDSSLICSGTLGRSWIVGGNRLYASTDAVTWRVVGSTPPDAGPWQVLVPYQGSLVACAHVELVSDEDSLAWTRSLVLPGMLF